ncbi:DNA invertase Pin-like site-specific DNA recombinase [Bradyrhizobium sp. AZCC 2262]|uniref:recombinase family protein n=1 Tax=Bradyrhizobium sp. AZCC 2262 TaxID=3117022 RepID=UPI002FF04879
MPKVALYARYSTDNQSVASIEDQFRICREHAGRERWQVVDTYHDAAISGASVILRPGVQSLLQDARRGKFDIVLAEALDRVSRDQADVATLFKHLRFAGVQIITLAEGEISEPHVGLKGTMDALFLKDLAAKTHRGLRGRVEKGKAGGGLCYGYEVVKRTDSEGELVRGERKINEAEAVVVRRIFREFAAGKSPRAIATDLNRDCIPGPFGHTWATRRSEATPAAVTALSTTSFMPGCWSGTGSASSRTQTRASVCRVRTPRRNGSGPKCWSYALSMTSCGSG